MNDFPYADTVIIALIAAFILLRLRAVLGQKTGLEKPPELLARPAQPEAPVVQIPSLRRQEGTKEEGDAAIDALTDEALKAELKKFRAVDPQFSLAVFLNGARGAFEMLHDAFRKGEREPLKMLLSDSLYPVFDEELKTREQNPHYHETTLVAIHRAEPVQAESTKTTLRVTVHFLSEQIALLRDKSGAIVEGNPSQSEQVQDEWIFERDAASRNPNWKIIDT